MFATVFGYLKEPRTGNHDTPAGDNAFFKSLNRRFIRSMAHPNIVAMDYQQLCIKRIAERYDTPKNNFCQSKIGANSFP
jgi:hypothetical protein